MGMIACKECNNEVSTKAKTCPSCGVKNPGIKMKDALGGLFILVIIVLGLSMCGGDDTAANVSASPTEWYSGGTLHQENAIAWQSASDHNRLATCADLIYTMKEKGILNEAISSRINTIDDLKPYAIELKVGLDSAFVDAENGDIMSRQAVSATSVLLVTMMGWTK